MKRIQSTVFDDRTHRSFRSTRLVPTALWREVMSRPAPVREPELLYNLPDCPRIPALCGKCGVRLGTWLPVWVAQVGLRCEQHR